MIVGQGLAGSILAFELLKRGKTICVIDRPELSHSSQVAGGLYNPVVFKRLTQSWMADRTLPEMYAFFQESEHKLNCRLLYETQIARVFAGEQEELIWKKKATNELAEFIENRIHQPEDEYSFVKSSFGYVSKAGYIDVLCFLKETRRYLLNKNSLVAETFDITDLQIGDHEIRYHGFSASHVIFCEGHLAQKNPYFKQVKFKPAKGEVLTIFCEQLAIKSIINKDFFILPLPEAHCFKVGATYDWVNQTDEISEEAKNKLLAKLDDFMPYPYRLINQQAGVRPSTIDRRPVMGSHSEHKNVLLFNGFGTKAVMLTPFFAKHFCNFICSGEELYTEVDVKRFYG